MDRLERVLKNAGITRQLYFHGSLVGNDIKKLMHAKIIKKLCHVLDPVNVSNEQQMEIEISSHQQKNEIYMLFNKLKQCYDLVTPARLLCKHEIGHLKIRCESFGNWFPTTFPNENLKFKFHILVYHAPEKAFFARTCGMESEQGN